MSTFQGGITSEEPVCRNFFCGGIVGGGIVGWGKVHTGSVGGIVVCCGNAAVVVW